MEELTKQRVLVVDDSPTNLRVAKNTLSPFYRVFTMPSAERMFYFLESHSVDLILLDIEMPDTDGFTAIKELKAAPRTANIPVIFLTGKSDADSELHGLDLGAVDYISKPFSPILLHKRVELHLGYRRQQELLKEQNYELQEAILTTVADLVESRDGSTGGHIERTRLYLQILVEGMAESGLYADIFAGWNLSLLYKSSLLHDVGKVSIPDNILNKPGRLTPEEFAVIQRHTTIGAAIIDRISEKTQDDFLVIAKILAITHHEWWNGKGYPDGLSGEDIPLQGRLMALADVYDALTSERPYKPPFSHEEAVRIISEEKGTHFDPKLTELFISIAGKMREARKNLG